MSKIKSFIEENKNSTKGKIAASVIVILALYILYSIYAWVNTQSTDNASLEGDITIVSAEVAGNIKQVNFIENMEVKTGDLLVKIEDENYKSLYEQAKAAVKIVESKIELAKIELSKAEDGYKLSSLSFDNSTKEYKRVSSLGKEHYSSSKQLEEAALGLKKSQTEFSSAELSVRSARENLKLLESELLSAKLNADGVDGRAGMSKFNFDNTEIRSPINGYITKSSARVGSYVRPGLPIMFIVPTDKLYVQANFKETQVAKFKPDMKVKIQFDATGSKTFCGKIRNLYPATGSKFSLIPTDNATGNFTKIVQKRPVIIDIEIPEEYKGKLAVGYSAFVSIRTDQ
jgi:membrane fusion protein, multidrug efflux system